MKIEVEIDIEKELLEDRKIIKNSDGSLGEIIIHYHPLTETALEEIESRIKILKDRKQNYNEKTDLQIQKLKEQLETAKELRKVKK